MSDASNLTMEGTTPFEYKGETYETYYKVLGDLAARTEAPLVVLHGGPGLVHNYLLPLADIATIHGNPVILYDQLGNGRSTHLRDKPAEFWTIDLFIAELENLLVKLGIQDAFSLFGHSWGGILGAEFAVRKQPAGMRHLILSNSLASFDLWLQSVGQLLQPLPEEVHVGMAAGMMDRKKYREALRQFHAVHGCLVRPVPAEFDYAIDQSLGEEGDPTVASVPLLMGWSIVDRLHLLRVPTFVINGRKDISQDFVVAPFFQGIRKVKWVTLENSSHTPFYEERELFMQLIADFLKLEV
ncbi:proline-specific peptidase [Trametes cingulata]|nr:proline-specific peptidase [Trametes cingulata]